MSVEDARRMAVVCRTAVGYQLMRSIYDIIHEQQNANDSVPNSITFDTENKDFLLAKQAYDAYLENKRKDDYETELWQKASVYVEQGTACEKAKDADGAIQAYEKAAAIGAPAPYCYERLRILYKKRKDFANMQRAIDMRIAAQNAYKQRTGKVYY